MSESTNSTASSSDLDNVPLVRFVTRGQEPPEIQNIEMVEYSEVTSGFVSECHNDEESTAGTVTEEESDNEAAADEVPIDIPQTSEQKPSESWPTLQVLPGGVIKPSENAEYPMNIYGLNENGAEGEDNAEEDGNLMYACAKCPERFKLLFCLVKHVRWHDDQKKMEEGHHLTKLTRTICCPEHCKQLTGLEYDAALEKDSMLEQQDRIKSTKKDLSTALGVDGDKLKNDCLKREQIRSKKKRLCSALAYSKNIQSKIHSTEIELEKMKYLYKMEQAKLEFSLAEENIKIQEQILQYNKLQRETNAESAITENFIDNMPI